MSALSPESALTNTSFGSASDVRFDYAYNPASQIVTNSRSADTYAFTGHANGATASSINGLNQIASNGGVTFAHDANGNLTSDGATTFAYDVENRLTSATGAKNATLVYDPSGRLTDATSAGVTTKLLYDGDDLIAEYDGATLLRRYVHGDRADEPLVHYEGAGLTDKRFLEADNQGSVILIANASGATLTTNRYDEYGKPQSTNAGRFGYTGQQWLPELGLNYYKARMYAPQFGRCLQTDPIGYDGGINLYEYVEDDPVNMTDPDGEEGIFSALIDWFSKPVPGTRVYEPSEIEQVRPEYANCTCDVGVLTDRPMTRGDVAIGVAEVVTTVVGARAGKAAGALRPSGFNPFKGRSTQQAARMLERKGFTPRGPQPARGKGGYVNPRTGRSYHVDPGKRPPPRKSEPPHVDVNRDSKLTPPRPNMEKRKLDLEER